jgi:hypothetical protein
MTGQVVGEKRLKVVLPQGPRTLDNISTTCVAGGAIGIENLTTPHRVRSHRTGGHAQDQHQSKSSGEQKTHGAPYQLSPFSGDLKQRW